MLIYCYYLPLIFVHWVFWHQAFNRILIFWSCGHQIRSCIKIFEYHQSSSRWFHYKSNSFYRHSENYFGRAYLSFVLVIVLQCSQALVFVEINLQKPFLTIWDKLMAICHILESYHKKQRLFLLKAVDRSWDRVPHKYRVPSHRHCCEYLCFQPTCRVWVVFRHHFGDLYPPYWNDHSRNVLFAMLELKLLRSIFLIYFNQYAA